MNRSVSVAACALVIVLLVSFVGCSSGNASSASSSSQDFQAVTSVSASEVSVESPSISSASTAISLGVGTYDVQVDTGSSMFHINKADKGRGLLTVSNDGMTVHIRLASKKITKLYLGTVDEAMADEAGALLPTTDTVTYDDGTTKEVYGFDVPVPSLDEPFDVAILGSKGKWYDHKVTVSDPIAK